MATEYALAQAWPLVILNQDISDKAAYNAVCTPSNCSGNGVCNPSTKVCECLPGWAGAGCDQSQCRGGCVPGQGECLWSERTQEFTCQCNGNWAGPSCTECTCPKTHYCTRRGECQSLLAPDASPAAQNLAASVLDRYQQIERHVKMMGDAADDFCSNLKKFKDTLTKWKTDIKNYDNQVKKFCAELQKFDPAQFQKYIQEKKKTFDKILDVGQSIYETVSGVCEPMPNIPWNRIRDYAKQAEDLLVKILDDLKRIFKKLQEYCGKENVQYFFQNVYDLLEEFEQTFKPVFDKLNQFCAAYQGKRICFPGWEGDGCKTCTMERLASEKLLKLDIEVCVGNNCETTKKEMFNFGKACFNNGLCDSVLGYLCACDETKWTGFRCSVPKCNPGCAVGEYCSVDCSYEDMMKGECQKTPSCKKCRDVGRDGYTGNGFFPVKICQDPVCTKECKNGGKCTSPNTCTCPSGWQGAQCTESTARCVNGTKTLDTGACTCNSGWSGAACDVPVCSATCENGGTCVGPNQCQCLEGWSGSVCTAAQCSPSCQNGGQCTSPDVCTCATGWVGATCARATCDVPCQNGSTCVSPNTCSKPCATGWEGDQCQLPVCSKESRQDLENATCIRPNEWTCSAGWEGVKCQTSQCKKPCQNGGTCIGENTCFCPEGWTGEQCQFPICAKPCQNGGTCIGENKCFCPTGWTGLQCETKTTP